ncbi:MAG: Crp/Fnr family transcriptional regulator, partial [Dehalococcoidia bacterium]|nr:Crp/Fnr family transcriptional regulator [Dehalococcoidia bacterium]
MPSQVDFLLSLPYFSALSSAEVERIGRAAVERTIERGEVLFLEGEPCIGLYVVKSGMVRVFKSSPEGREQVVLVARPGDSFNDIPVFDGGPNPASSAALERTTVLTIPGETVLSLIKGCPPAAAIIELFARRLRRLTTLVGDLSFRNVISRLAKVLLEVAVSESGPAPAPRLTQEEMAAMVGTVRDVIGRALRLLEKEGAIKLQRQRIVVVDP